MKPFDRLLAGVVILASAILGGCDRKADEQAKARENLAKIAAALKQYQATTPTTPYPRPSLADPNAEPTAADATQPSQ